MGLRINHVVIKVKDLAEAKGNFANLGFTVREGGDYKGFNNEAIIYLADGTYIELFDFTPSFILSLLTASWKIGLLKLISRFKPMKSLLRFGGSLSHTPGFMFYSIESDNMDQDVRTAEDHGIRFTAPTHYRCDRPGNPGLSWTIMAPEALDLPFLRTPIDPKPVVTDEDTTHENGVTGIDSIIVLVKNLDATVKRFDHLTGGKAKTDNRAGDKHITLDMGCGAIVLRDAGENETNRAYIRSRGEIPCELVFKTTKAENKGRLDSRLTNNARMTLT
jgi:catechol 2,3-dioxygenase-like lactoylglutathione lyase family enzyme